VPSSLIFTGLVVLWLLILVPAVARHQQEVARPSGASLAARVLARPHRRGRGRTEEGNRVDGDDLSAVATRAPTTVLPGGSSRRQPSTSSSEPPRWVSEPEPEAARGRDERDGTSESRDPVPLQYRPGRGGFDPAADARTARRRYAFRQRAVLVMLLVALATGIAAALWKPVLWWAHGGVDVVLVAYLVYLRRQVRLEMAIRRRRAARLTGNRRTSGDLSVLDEWARRSQGSTPPPVVRAGSTASPFAGPDADEVRDPDDEDDVDADAPGELTDALAEDGDAARVRGVGEPIGLLPARRRGVGGDAVDPAEPVSSLPKLEPSPPPALPPGTELLALDEDELQLQDLRPAHPDERCNVG
jgi:hypothetical protein